MALSNQVSFIKYRAKKLDLFSAQGECFFSGPQIFQKQYLPASPVDMLLHSTTTILTLQMTLP